ncbi:uncharacterized protein K452DRAFT_362598 [Aplosporella prunicola CBS 121167]|uniref:Uncharacterized protein n=1 Tax=Aplosporella prunicola CBS 121167 TaxID=1176127 RepID=A0A6A6AWG7_9PEZI|nr:uncharacterized protein K452DRAFT_362598 [Aplosporella prunicola CBS 121167]KAF2136342.1 hypothetical protein K452DRAFT_362598 [Aplosporella prunicola CBS 121167]
MDSDGISSTNMNAMNRPRQPSVQAMLAKSFGSASSNANLESREGELGSAFRDERTPSSSPSKSRSLSDSTPRLSPSPKIVSMRESKDDATINPRTPRRPDFLSRGLSLQMPPRDLSLQNPATFTKRVPLSPQLDAHDTYGSPATVLPRHSRGLDFARACTNLHHSTLAEQPSPDSSPTITQKGMMIPQRKTNITSMTLDSPNMSHERWLRDKSVPSSSLGSINMLGSDDSSSGSDEDYPMEPDNDDDPMVMTPQVLKLDRNAGNPFGGQLAPSPGQPWTGGFPSNGPNFLQIQRNRLRKVRSRKSSSSASGHSSLASPGPGSPPLSKAFDGSNGGYFAREAVMRKAGSRRESLSMVANDLHISSGNDSGDESGMPAPSTPGVVRRVVTRRGNLLPKSRQFGRIRAELFEENAPVDSEVKREAEIIRQVRESDVTLTPDRQESTTANSSPSLLPAVPGLSELEDIPEDTGMDVEREAAANGKGLFGAFNLQPWRSNGERQSWGVPNDRMHTPPPPPFFPRASSSAISDDINMDSPSVSTTSMSGYPHRLSQSAEPPKDRSTSRGSTPQPMVPPTAADGLKKKRRRDDDFDVNSIKRRAVSPGLSVTNSPVLSQSPNQRDNSIWPPAKTSREGSTSGQPSGHGAGERSNSGGSTMSVTPSLGPKRVGLQGMTDTNDGLMKMSIE